MPVDLPENESIGGAEINLTLCPVAIWLKANLC